MLNPRKHPPLYMVPEIYKLAPSAVRGRPGILLPFAAFAALELLVLAFLYLAPRVPVNAVLGPPIRVFWGEMFLHYPNNFLLLPKLAALARVVLYITAGSFLTGVAVMRIYGSYTGTRNEDGIMAAAKRYAGLSGCSLLASALFFIFVRAEDAYLSFHFAGHETLLFLPAAIWKGPVGVFINLFAGLLIQSVFIYSIPAMLIEKAGALGAMVRSLRLFRQFPLPTFCLVGLPVLLYAPIMVLQYQTPFFVNGIPESVLAIAIAGSLVNSLLVDVIVTISTTCFYLRMGGR